MCTRACWRNSAVRAAAPRTPSSTATTLEPGRKDLNALVAWKNLIPRHDGGRSTTIEDYLRKRFRYQMSPYSVEIESMVENLEKIRGFGGSLEPTLLDDIAAALRAIQDAGGVSGLRRV